MSYSCVPQLGELKQAEDALCEANILNNLDPVIWAYLTLVCLQVWTWLGVVSCHCGAFLYQRSKMLHVDICVCMQTDRIVEAEQAYKFAVKVTVHHI